MRQREMTSSMKVLKDVVILGDKGKLKGSGPEVTVGVAGCCM